MHARAVFPAKSFCFLVAFFFQLSASWKSWSLAHLTSSTKAKTTASLRCTWLRSTITSASPPFSCNRSAACTTAEITTCACTDTNYHEHRPSSLFPLPKKKLYIGVLTSFIGREYVNLDFQATLRRGIYLWCVLFPIERSSCGACASQHKGRSLCIATQGSDQSVSITPEFMPFNHLQTN